MGFCLMNTHTVRPVTAPEYLGLLTYILPAYIAHDFPSQLPVHIPSAGLVLEPGDARFSLYADDDWNTLFPPESRNGFTDLGPHNRTFGVAFMHQLHCLDILRIGYVTNRTGFAHHFEHCLHYLRQALLCHADTTLEVTKPILVHGTWKLRTNGVGSVHRCRDWTALRRYLDEHPTSPVNHEEI